VDLNVLQTAPPRLESKVTNRTNGDAFSFSWKSAGRGGFTSSTPAGRTTGVGAKWVWSTNQPVYAFTGTICAKDIWPSFTLGSMPPDSASPSPAHPGDVARRFILSATGNVGGFGAFAMDMPLSLGIADRCDPAAQSGDFDGLEGC
jgi:hypothetical protein